MNRTLCLVLCTFLVAMVLTAPARAQTTRPAATTAPAKSADEPADAPAAPGQAAPASAEPAEDARPKMMLQYKNAPLNDVIRLFAQRAGKPLLDQPNVPGTLTFYDAQPYTFGEAMDTLNKILAARGYIMMEEDRYFRVVPVTAIQQLPIEIYQGLDDTEKVRPGKIVTVLYPLKYLEPNKARQAIQRMVSAYGSVSPLIKGKGLILTDHMENIRRATDLLRRLDTELLTKEEIKTVRLEHAKASALAGIINKLVGPASRTKYTYDPNTGRYVRSPETGPGMLVSHDDRTNTILLVGSGEAMVKAERLIDQLDTDQKIAENMRIFAVKNGSAEEMASTLSKLIPQRRDRRGRPIPGDTRIIADATTNRLIVTAPVDDMSRIEQMIRELDESTVAESGRRIIQLQSAEATSMVAVLRGAISSRDSRGRVVSKLNLAADPRTNSLVIAGSPKDIEMAEGILKQLDVERGAEAREVHVVQLGAGDARQIARSLMNIFSRQTRDSRGRPVRNSTLTVEADSGTNSLIVSARPDDWPRVEKILTDLKAKAQPFAAPATRKVPLKHAKADEIAQTLNRIYDPRVRGRGRPRGAPPLGPVVIAPSSRTNSLLISANQDDQKALDMLIQQLDVPEGDDPNRQMVRTYQLTHSKAAELARSLPGLFAKARRGRSAQGEPDPRFQADAATNRLMVSATTDQFQEIEKLLEKLNGAADAASLTKTYKLQHAKVSDIQPLIETMLAESAPSRRGRRGASLGDVRVTAMEATNTLVIQGSSDRIALAEQLLQTFDTPEAAKQAGVRIIQVQHAQAENLAATLRAMMPRPPRGQQPDVFIQADALSNSVLLRAPEAQRKLLEKMIADLDASVIDFARETRIIELKHASAQALTGVIGQFYPGSAPSRRGRRRTPQQGDAEKVIVSAAPNDRMLVIDAPKKKIEEIAQLVGSLDTPEATGELVVRTYDLAGANAVNTARSLAKLFAQQRSRRGQPASSEPQPRFEGDATTGQLMVAATAKQFEEIEPLVKQLNKVALATQTRTFHLEHAQAAELAPMLQTMLAGSSGGRRGSTGMVRVAAMTTANAVVVHAPAEKVQMAAELVKTFDAEAPAGTAVKVVKLTNADAATLAQAVGSALAAQRSRRGGGTPGVSVTAEANSNSVLVRGPSAQVEEAIAMIRGLDRDSDPAQVELRVIKVTNADADELAQNVGRMFKDIISQQRRGRRGPTAPFSIVGDTRTNSLAISATPAHHELVKQLVSSLDKAPERPEVDVNVVSLENADAFDVANILTSRYKDRRGPDKPVIEADVFSNSLTIIAKDEDLKQMEPIIAKMDQAARDTTIQVRVIPMAQVRAERMAEILKRVYGQMTNSEVIIRESVTDEPSKEPGKQVWPTMEMIETLPEQSLEAIDGESPDPQGQGDPADATEETAPAEPATQPGEQADAPTTQPAGEPKPKVIISIDRKTNSLIVSGQKRELTDIEDLITQLTAGTSDAESEFRLFKIERTDPAQMAKTLDALFNPTVTVKDSKGRSRTQKTQNVVIVPEPQTRNIIVRAKPIEFDMIAQIVKELDQIPTVVSDIKIFALENTDAEELAESLRELFRLASKPAPKTQKGKKTPQQNRAETVRQMIQLKTDNGTRQVDPTETVNISANKSTNSLIVSAPSDAMALITQLVRELDQSVAPSKVPIVRMYPLSNADVSTTVGNLRKIFRASSGSSRRGGGKSAAAEAPIVITGDEAGKLVIVSAPDDKHELVAKVISDIDAAQGPGKLAIAVYKIEYADAAQVASALTQTLTTGGRRGSTTGLRISADRSSNSVVVRGSKDDQAEVGRLIADMDKAPTEQYPVRVIAVSNADADQLANLLNRVINASGSARSRRGRTNANVRAIIEADRSARMLLVRADEETFNKIRGLAVQLDTSTEQSAKRTLITLQSAQAQQVASTLQQAFAPRRGQRLSPEDLVTVVAETGSNSIIVTANDKNLARVRDLLKTIDAEGIGGRRTEFVVLKHARAAEVAQTLGGMSGGAVDRRGRRIPGQGVAIAADSASNALVMSGPGGELDKLMQLALKLDQAAAEKAVATVKMYLIENADVNTVVGAVQKLFPQPSRGRRGEQAETPVYVFGDQASRKIIVSAPESKHSAIAKVIADMDAAGEGEQTVVRIYKLNKADANTVWRPLDQTLSSRSRGAANQITVRADRSSNSLIVRASAKEHEEIAKLIEQMDVTPSSKWSLRSLTMDNADAGNVAKVLNRVFREGASNATGLLIEGDSASKTVMIRSDDETFAKIEALAKKMDAATTETQDALIKAYDLAHVPAPSVVNALKGLFPRDRRSQETPVQVFGEAGTKKVVVSASPKKHELIAKTIEEMDVADEGSQMAVKIYRMENAHVGHSWWALDQALGRGASGNTGVTVRADSSSNSFIVKATQKQHEQIAQLISELDKAPTAGNEVRTITLENGDARQIAGMLARVFEAGKWGKTGGIMIEGDSASKALLVRADEVTFEKIKTLATSMDKAAEAEMKTEIRAYAIANAEVPSVVNALRQLFPYRRARWGQPQEAPVQIFGEPGADKVVVSATPDKHELIAKVVQDLDAAQEGEKAMVKIYRMKNAEVGRSWWALDQALGRSATGQTGVFVRADSSSNSFIVRASESQHEQIAKLIEQLDVSPTAEAIVRTIKLEKGDARRIAQMLARVFSAGRGSGISIDGDTNARSIVVRSDEATFQKIKDLAISMDSAATGEEDTVVKSYPIANAEVPSVVDALRQLFTPQRRWGAPQPAPVKIFGEAGAGRVVVAATPEIHEQVAKVLTDLDAADASQRPVARVYKLENADAGSIWYVMHQALNGNRRRGEPERATVRGDRSTNSLVVFAPEPMHKEVSRLLEVMDVSATEDLPIRTIALKNADPRGTARMLSQMFNAGRYSRNRSGQSTLIEGDVTSKTLMIRADDATYEKIAAAVAKIDEAPAGKMVREVLPLEHAQAGTVARSLQRAFQPQRGQPFTPDDLVTVVEEPGTNTLVVTASADKMAEVKELLGTLDSKEFGQAGGQMLLLKSAKATEVAAVLSRVAGSNRRRGSAGVTVSADAASNAIVMSGPRADVDRLMVMAQQLDQATPPSNATAYVIKLDNGVASDVARQVQEIYNQQARAARSQRRTIDPLAVTADDRANALVLATTPDMYQQVNQWVGQVEQLKPRAGRLQIIQLKNVDPAEVQKAIDQLFGGTGADTLRGANAPRGRRGNDQTVKSGRVESTVLVDQKSVLVNASEADYETILKLVKALEAAAAESKQITKVFTLKNATNTRVAAALSSVYRGRSGTDAVTVTALADTKAIVVAASKENMEEVAHLVEQLDKTEVAPQLEFRIFTLKNAQPTKVLPLLQQMLAQVRRVYPDETIDVQADERTRSIIVTARTTVFDQIEKIINMLDKAPAFKQADVLVMPLKEADAPSLAAVLREMLRPTDTGELTAEARALQEQLRVLAVRGALKEELPQLDLSKPIKISSDPDQRGRPGSNTLIITSTPDNLKAMKAVVELLDTVPLAENATVRLVRLENADAESVMQILKDAFTQGKQLAGKPGTTVEGKAEPEDPAGKALVNPLNVSADARTNTLVLSGIEETVALAEVIAKDLDGEKGRVVTEVKLFKLRHAAATRMVETLSAVFAEQTPTPETEGLQTQVTRLRTALADKLPKTTEKSKSRPALVIRADEPGNILIVAARADVMPLIADVVSAMDVPQAGAMNTVRFFPLENADAADVQKIVSAMYTGPNAKFVRDEDKPTVSVDERTNTLVVSASEKTFTVIGALLKQLDAKAAIDVRQIKLIPLENATASSLAQTLQQMMDQRVQRQEQLGVKDAEKFRVVIVPDARSNHLVVAGTGESFELVQKLASQLDGASPAIGGKIELVELTHANAGSIVSTLQTLFEQRYAKAAAEETRRQQPVLLPDARTNAILFSGTEGDLKIVKSLLGRIDVELTDPAVQLKVLYLKNNSAVAVAPTLEQIFAARLKAMTLKGETPEPADEVSIEADPLANALIVSASRENLLVLGGLLAKIDVVPADQGALVKMFPLKLADAQRVSTMLQGLVSQGLYKPGAVAAGSNQLVAAREKVSIVVDTRTNVLVVSASPENMQVLGEVIAKLDSAEDYSVLGDVRVFQLKRADATRLAPTLQGFFATKRQAEIQAGSSGRSLPVNIVADARTNTLLVAGSREAFAAVEAMIAKLDGEQTASATRFKVFDLKQATAAALEPTLRRLFDQRVARGGTKDPVSIIADARTNSLIVGASAEDMAVAEALVRQLDVARPDEGKNLHAFALRKADASQVAATLQNLYQTADGSAGVSISVDERTNTLLVSAGEADAKRIAGLVAKLDVADVTQVTEVKVFSLDNADATELAEILTEALTTKPEALTAKSPNRQTLLQFITQSKEGKKLVTSALQQGLLITPDRRTNTLVVTAPIDTMPLLGSLIRALDSTSPRAAEIQVFPLTNADARQMAVVLTELFGLTSTGGAANQPGRAVQYTLTTTQPAEGQNSPASATVNSDEQEALTVTVDGRTNSLLIGGTKQYVAMCARIIEQLDASPAQERLTSVYRPKNAQAADIESAVSRLLDQELQRMRATLGTDNIGALQRLLEREVAIVAEQNTNTLLVSASPRYFKTVRDMIEELDKTPPQVLIQVLLAEVTLDDNTDLGFDWQYAFGQDGADVNVGTDFGVQAGIDQFGGFSLSVTGSKLTFFLRALQSQGRLQVLSRPQILATDNQEARINIGQRVPFITNSRVTDNGTTLNTIQYEPIGINLAVTPRISDMGFVSMDVLPEISSLTTSSVQISENVNARIVNNRSAETRVTVQDGQTIVIGGLISTRDEDREDKVPLLGDVPLVGNLFRTTSITKERTELLIVLTPRIINSPDDAKRVSDEQVEHLNYRRNTSEDNIDNPTKWILNNSPRKKSVVESGWDDLVPNGQSKPGDGQKAPADDDSGAGIPLESLPATLEERNQAIVPERRTEPVGPNNVPGAG